MPLFYRDSVSGSAIDTIQTINSATSTTATAWASTVQAAFTTPGQTLSASAIPVADVGKTTTIVNTGTNAFTLAQTGGSITSAIGLTLKPGATCALKAVSTTASIIVGTNANQTASAEYGEQVLATSVSIPSTSTGAGNATDVLSFTLPSVGIWEVEYAVRATTPNQTATSVTGMVALIANNSNVVQSGSEIAIARFQSGATSGSGNNLGATGSGKTTIATAGAETFKLRGHHDGSANGSQAYSVQSDANGRTRVCWIKISGFLPIVGNVTNRINISSRAAQTTGLTIGSPILFNSPDVVGSGVTQSAGVFTLPANGEYDLEGGIGFVTSGTEIIAQWRNITTNTLIGVSLNSHITVAGRNSMAKASVVAGNTPVTVRLEIVNNNGVTGLSAGDVANNGRGNWANITQLGSSATTGLNLNLTTTGTGASTYNSGTSTLNIPNVINDQSVSGFVDIGNTRIQWGRSSMGATPTTVNFPATFLNTNYTITGNGINGASTSVIQAPTFNPLSTSQFTFAITFINSAGNVPAANNGAQISWMAIGQKP